MRSRKLFVALSLAALGLGACHRAPEATKSSVATTTVPAAPAAPAPFRASDLPRIDMHVHLTPRGAARAVKLLGAQGIVHFVDLSGGPPGLSLEAHLAAAADAGHISVFTTPDFRECESPGCGPRLAAQLERAKKLGAVGLKIPKALGLGWVGPDGKLLAVDDPMLDPLFEKAGELGMPVAIHTGDPKAFWSPPTPVNERWDELSAHPGWSYYGEPVPSWQALFDAFERRVARHPHTTFIGVHFGNDPEDPDRVDALLTAHPNLYIDTAARVPAIGRPDAAHDRDKMRAFYLKWQDRILFGTDTGIGSHPDEMMFGSTGKDPPTVEDMVRFFTSTWRYFETLDRDIPTPTPIQGRWNVDGVGLPRDVLAKIYGGNAARLLHLAWPPAPSVNAR
jgi:predicted TIM-barrel fold metal-dependent hydrolase